MWAGRQADGAESGDRPVTRLRGRGNRELALLRDRPIRNADMQYIARKTPQPVRGIRYATVRKCTARLSAFTAEIRRDFSTLECTPYTHGDTPFNGANRVEPWPAAGKSHLRFHEETQAISMILSFSFIFALRFVIHSFVCRSCSALASARLRKRQQKPQGQCEKCTGDAVRAK